MTVAKSKLKNRFCMACENRENDPGFAQEFVLKCKQCGYWLCDNCRGELESVNQYGCLNCGEKLIPQIVEFEPVIPASSAVGQLSRPRAGREPLPLVRTSSDEYRDIPLRASIETDVFRDVPIRVTTETSEPERAPDWSSSPEHKVNVTIGGKLRKLSELEPVKQPRREGRMKDCTPEMLSLMKEKAWSVRELAKSLGIMHVASHRILMKLMEEGKVGRGLDPGSQKMYYTLIENFPEERREKALRRYQTNESSSD